MLILDNITVKYGAAIALGDVSLRVAAGTTLAVVGESGAGKSTLIGCILGLLRVATGTILWNGAPVSRCRPALVMQEPRAAFNPGLTLMHSVMEPVVASKQGLAEGRLERLCRALDLTPEILARKPGEISVGQAQRVGILRALLPGVPLILFDEPLSALDAVTQKDTARLIADLQREEGFTALIVTHDLGYACACCDQIAVLRAGRVEEVSTPDAFARAPQTDYGRRLRAAAISLGAMEETA